MDNSKIQPNIKQMLRDQDYKKLMAALKDAGPGSEEAYKNNMFFHKTMTAILHGIPSPKLLLDLSKIIERQQLIVTKVLSYYGDPSIMRKVQDELNEIDNGSQHRNTLNSSTN